MMGVKVIKMPSREVTKDLVVKVRLADPVSHGLRVQVGGFLFALGAAIMGVRFEVERE